MSRQLIINCPPCDSAIQGALTISVSPQGLQPEIEEQRELEIAVHYVSPKWHRPLVLYLPEPGREGPHKEGPEY